MEDKIITALLGTLAVSTALPIARSLNRHILKKFDKNNVQNEEINKLQLKQAKEENISVVDQPEYDNSCYIGQKYLSKLHYIRKHNKREYREYKLYYAKEGIDLDYVLDHAETKAVLLGKDHDTSTIAHELGHGYYQDGEGQKTVPGVAHKTYSFGSILSKLSPVVGLGMGILDSNKLEPRIGRGLAISMGASILASLPVLISERAASRRAIKKLKEHGLQGKELRKAKRKLRAALNTYRVCDALLPSIVSTGLYFLGRSIPRVEMI